MFSPIGATSTNFYCPFPTSAAFPSGLHCFFPWTPVAYFQQWEYHWCLYIFFTSCYSRVPSSHLLKHDTCCCAGYLHCTIGSTQQEETIGNAQVGLATCCCCCCTGVAHGHGCPFQGANLGRSWPDFGWRRGDGWISRHSDAQLARALSILHPPIHRPSGIARGGRRWWCGSEASHREGGPPCVARACVELVAGLWPPLGLVDHLPKFWCREDLCPGRLLARPQHLDAGWCMRPCSTAASQQRHCALASQSMIVGWLIWLVDCVVSCSSLIPIWKHDEVVALQQGTVYDHQPEQAL
jgi:hypothetical protein